MSKPSEHSHRELQLLDALRRFGGFARNSELATSLDVSEETIRRAIKALAKSGSVARVHGGAYLAGVQSDPSFFRRITENAKEKRAIAGEVANLVSDGMTLFLDVGSTTAFVAEELRLRRRLMVVTNSVKVAQSLVGHNRNRVFLLGGEMQANELGAFGSVTERQVRRYSYDMAIFSADALNERAGFCYLNPLESDLAAVVAAQAEIRLMAITHNKFGQTAPHHGFPPQFMDLLVADRRPDPGLCACLSGWGVDLRLTTEELPDAQIV